MHGSIPALSRISGSPFARSSDVIGSTGREELAAYHRKRSSSVGECSATPAGPSYGNAPRTNHLKWRGRGGRARPCCVRRPGGSTPRCATGNGRTRGRWKRSSSRGFSASRGRPDGTRTHHHLRPANVRCRTTISFSDGAHRARTCRDSALDAPTNLSPQNARYAYSCSSALGPRKAAPGLEAARPAEGLGAGARGAPGGCVGPAGLRLAGNVGKGSLGGRARVRVL
jgi:hypothetical protein